MDSKRHKELDDALTKAREQFDRKFAEKCIDEAAPIPEDLWQEMLAAADDGEVGALHKDQHPGDVVRWRLKGE